MISQKQVLTLIPQNLFFWLSMIFGLSLVSQPPTLHLKAKGNNYPDLSQMCALYVLV